ncbi:hypothetical protein BP00DRAFT_422544 [Aspergillus indologenus CBS 114.80]|uniref:Uncharacterized protein n=1 Tax=Aspergillus indologenus CBS 114.80 TaxID=1450541 RepID=A0A2V5ILT3_9EURO|nr:hypothetical protein BP00DRAFT_422544 [Aspergillus indologenus CBS 114.80]
MDPYDDQELWVSEDESDQEEQEGANDPIFFVLELQPEGQPGGFKVRNVDGVKQRSTISSFHSGSRRRPAFEVQCVGRAIIHGTLTRESGQRATLLIYDFTFKAHRSTRIKNASINFDFLPGPASSKESRPTVRRIAPDDRYSVLETTQFETRRVTAKGTLSGGPLITIGGEIGVEKSEEKTITCTADINGSRPSDDRGQYWQARWDLQENKSQESGIVTCLRTCVLLTRKNDEDFCCAPYVRITPNLATQIVSLGSRQSRDEAVFYDPGYEPYNELEEGNLKPIDRWNLGLVDLDRQWDCTFYKVFGNAIKSHVTNLTPRHP